MASLNSTPAPLLPTMTNSLLGPGRKVLHKQTTLVSLHKPQFFGLPRKEMI